MQNHARWSRRGEIQSESSGLCFLPLPPTHTKQSGKAGHGAGNRVEEATGQRDDREGEREETEGFLDLDLAPLGKVARGKPVSPHSCSAPDQLC